ncbi:hypothetical protein BT93_F2165 [Corymbia citriodora subsp. variegata]|nr:hypothetical protein BT93_F2165 [Corymbia citriodora subsp. variegata]
MEELRTAAKLHYRDNGVFKKAFQRISDRLDFEFENKLNYQNFVTLVEERSRRCTSKALFHQLDWGEKSHLDRDDVRVLYYLMDTRGDCSHCSDILRSVYYTCLHCFDNCMSPNNPTFNVCATCYRTKAFKHPQQHIDFVDNYELLQKRRFQRLNWEELRQSAVQGVVTGLLVGAIKEGCKEKEAIAQGLGDMFNKHPNQTPEADVSDAPIDSVPDIIEQGGNGIVDALTEIFQFFVQ